MPDERRRVVAAGYDRVANRYRRWAARIEDDPRERTTAKFAARLPDGARGEVVEIHEPDGPVPFLWILARRG